MPLLERLEKEYSDIMVQLAINIQEPKEMIEDYVQSQGIHSRVLMDQEGTVSMAYGAVAIPTQVLIDRDGVVRYIQEGFSPAAGFSQLRAEIEKLR
jgi:peroxiredoxin